MAKAPSDIDDILGKEYESKDGLTRYRVLRQDAKFEDFVVTLNLETGEEGLARKWFVRDRLVPPRERHKRRR